MTTQHLMGLADLTNEIAAGERHRATARKAFEDLDRELEIRLRELHAKRAAVANGVPADAYDLALTVLEVSGTPNTARRQTVVEKAIRDLAAGAPTLRRDYLGTKNYASWTDQEIACEYGMSPTYGAVVFRVGLTDAARKRLVDGELTVEEREAAIQYLLGLSR